jgi:hypothetical protein
MKRIALLIVLVALSVAAGVSVSPARSATRGVGLLDALPDGTAVAVIDFQKIAGSSLWASINAQDKFKSGIDRAQSEMADLGLTLSDVHTIAMVFPGAGLNSPTLALSGGFEQNELLARLRASGKVNLTSEKYKDLDIYRARSTAGPVPSKRLPGTAPARATIATVTKEETSFVFYDASTLVIGSVDAVRASIDVKTGAKPGLNQNSKLTEALAQNPAAAIRFAFALTPAMTNGLRSGELPIDFSSLSLIFGTVDVGSGIDLNATLRSDNAEHAKSLSETLNALLKMARGFLGSTGNPKMAPIAEALKTVNIISADADVRITGKLPLELLNNLLSFSSKKGQ